MNSNNHKSKRFLSPSFKKGVLKPKDQGGEFKINLVNDFDDEDNSPSNKQKSYSKFPSKVSPNKKAGNLANQMNFLSFSPGKSHIKSLAYHSEAGKGEDGLVKINQDSYLVLSNIFKLDDFNIFGVLDGHGLTGHLISQFVTKFITSSIQNNKLINQLTNEEEIYLQLKKNNYEIIKKYFVNAEREIAKSQIDANFSGTTCVTLFQLGNHLICSNAGDSRCIMVGDKIHQLSIDQKPDLENEKKRILKNGGEVSQYEEDGIKSGPFRVWKKNEMYPGLAMSRSIGDLIASTLGVIPEPEIIEMELESTTQFIIIASDGVWEFLDNKTVKDIVMPYYLKNDPNGACKELIAISTKWWEKEDIVVDDITVISLFFNHK